MKMDKEQRRAVVLDAAVKLATERGLAAVTFADVAELCEVVTSPATVRRYAKRIGDLQRAVIIRAKGTAAYTRLKNDARRLGISLTA